jgi:hypothetical protein
VIVLPAAARAAPRRVSPFALLPRCSFPSRETGDKRKSAMCSC